MSLQLEGELYNGRLAMLAAVGILTVEYLGKGPWWTAPVAVSRPHLTSVRLTPFVILSGVHRQLLGSLPANQPTCIVAHTEGYQPCFDASQKPSSLHSCWL